MSNNNKKEQNEQQEAGVAIKVFGLRKEEIEDEDLIGEIEKHVEHQLELSNVASKVGDNILFAFPWDPSVTTANKPILVEVTLFSKNNDLVSDICSFSKRIKEAIDVAFYTLGAWSERENYSILEEPEVRVITSKASAFVRKDRFERFR